SRVAQRARVVAREVHRFGDFRVRLGRRLGAVEHHHPDELAPLAHELGSARLEPHRALRDGPPGPHRQGRAGCRERPIDVARPAEAVAVSDAIWARGVVALALSPARTELATYLERDDLRRALLPAVYEFLDPRAVLRERPVGVEVVPEPSLGRGEGGPGLRLGRPVLRAAGGAGPRRLAVQHGEVTGPRGVPTGMARSVAADPPQQALP